VHLDFYVQNSGRIHIHDIDLLVKLLREAKQAAIAFFDLPEDKQKFVLKQAE